MGLSPHQLFSLVWINGSKVTEGADSAPQAENVLYRPDEVRLTPELQLQSYKERTKFGRILVSYVGFP